MDSIATQLYSDFRNRHILEYDTIHNTKFCMGLLTNGAKMLLMAKKKSDTPPKGLERYRKPRRIVGVPEALAVIVAQVAEDRFTDLTTECIRYIREGLIREGRLPDRTDRPAS